jgi:plastocyanin
MHRVLLVVALVAFSVAAASCDAGPPTCDTPTDTTTVDMEGSAFAPECVAVSADQTLTLINADDAPHTYTVSGTGVDVKIEGRATAEAVLLGIAPGTYAVTCLYHPEMTATLRIT